MFSGNHIKQFHEAIEKHKFNTSEFLIEPDNDQIVITHKSTKFYFKVVHMPVVGLDKQFLKYIFLTYHTPSKQGELYDNKQEKFQDAQAFTNVINQFIIWVALIRYEFVRPANLIPSPAAYTLTHLHPTLRQIASSRFASGHYSDAIQKACTALEKVVQAKAGQPATVTGTSLMTTAFSKNSPLIQVAADPNEQFGFMNLYQGTVQALRNHYAHNLTELTDPARALEWLGFISALLYKLDEAQLPVTPPAP